jgi:hypothetical protein
LLVKTRLDKTIEHNGVLPVKQTFVTTKLCIVRVALFLWLAAIMSVGAAQAETASYVLNEVIMHNAYNGQEGQMTGIFSWTYDLGDFENGVGTFSELFIPWLAPSDYALLVITFDIGNSIEFTRGGISEHDAGIDITLFFQQALTPTGSTLLDLARSKFDIGGNGFIKGAFTDGSISSVADGDLNGDGLVNTADVLLSTRIIMGQLTPTQDQINHGDVAPLVNGIPVSDGLFRLSDALVIQRKALGLINF